jgi:hypothetical protein
MDEEFPHKKRIIAAILGAVPGRACYPVKNNKAPE